MREKERERLEIIEEIHVHACRAIHSFLVCAAIKFHILCTILASYMHILLIICPLYPFVDKASSP